MILINLLPHREAARKRKREAFYAALGLSALIGGLIAGGIFLWYQARLSAQETRNVFLQGEIVRLDGQIKEIANLQAEISALKARQQAVEDLQADRNLPIHLLNELIKQLPDGVFITKLTQKAPTLIEFSGSAQSDERVSELLKNLNYNSDWIGSPELIEIVGTQFLLGKDSRRVSNFAMKATMKRAAVAPASTASAPLSSASSVSGSVTATITPTKP